MNIQHSSQTDRWATPLPILDRVRQVIGSIDLDPASNLVTHETRVRSRFFFDERSDGLAHTWDFGEPVSVFCNPPGGKRGNKSMTGLFWRKLLEERMNGHVSHAIFLCFSAEALQSTQGKDASPIGDFPLCIPAKRIRFDAMEGEAKFAPSHSNAIVYVPGIIDLTDRFAAVFGRLGSILVPHG